VLPPEIAGSAGVPPASTKCGRDARAPFFDPFAETEVTEHKLPHWTQLDCHCFVTWRLDDAMPREKLDEWKQERDAWLSHHPKPWNDEVTREYYRLFSQRLDEWLDAGHGSCVLREPHIRKIITDALAHFDGQRYVLASYVVMPNHVHVLFQTKEGYNLGDILHAWKSFTSKAINKALNSTGTLWQPEYWDRLIRNEDHLAAGLAYIQKNPAKAGLGSNAFTHWSAGVSPASTNCARPARAPFLERRAGRSFP